MGSLPPFFIFIFVLVTFSLVVATYASLTYFAKFGRSWITTHVALKNQFLKSGKMRFLILLPLIGISFGISINHRTKLFFFGQFSIK